MAQKKQWWRVHFYYPSGVEGQIDVVAANEAKARKRVHFLNSSGVRVFKVEKWGTGDLRSAREIRSAKI